MRLFSIGDLHLPGGDVKPMNVFGSKWDNHFEKIREDWLSRVTDDDAVLLPGDFSWAMHLKDALPDLLALADLPGRKVICKGNHDYWWSSITQLRSNLPQGMYALQNDAVDLGEVVVCGSRGWTIPTKETPLSQQDQHLFDRQVIRMKLSLDQAMRLKGDRPIVVMTHFPPLYDLERDTPMTALLQQYPVSAVTYGHLHGAGIRAGFNGEWKGIKYHLDSCDALDFKLHEIEIEADRENG